jgi:serine-type D-Ala-D-Ala carboxypeptidase (penicillin-binding protein 5/6)
MAGSPSKNSEPLLHKILNFNKGILVAVVAVLVCVIGIVHFQTNHPQVEARPTYSSITLPGQFRVVFPPQGESAVGTDKFGLIASSPDQSPVPIASVAKIMTAYLVLKAHPLPPGEEGPTLTMSAQDVSDYVNDLAKDYSVLKVIPGEKLTERQLLEGLMLPSGDNIATTLGRWVAGSNAAFVAKMNEAAQSLGMTQTHYADASGVSQATVSNAADQIRIAQAAMEDQAFREIVALPQVTFPVAGTVYNVNSMLGKHGIAGIKTGSTLAAGGCFVSAAPIGVGTNAHYIITAVLGQKTGQSLQSAFDASVDILEQVRPEFKFYTLAPPPTGFGQAVTGWQKDSALNSPKPVQIFGYPGMTAALSVKVLKTQLPIPSGENMAVLRVASGKSVQEFPLQSSEQIDPPGVLWRFFRNWF